MAEQVHSDYAAIARARWPRAAVVTGSGQYAVRFLQNGRNVVRLFEDSKEAIPFGHANHGDYFNLDWYQPPVRFVRKPHWAPYIED
jgi:hypothetical protein